MCHEDSKNKNDVMFDQILYFRVVLTSCNASSKDGFHPIDLMTD